ncbi:outer membrane beta-barrel family protein, partial [Arthrospira platensis SPKY1]|nr:outer membrane beta-barrel family protein [Arthrospira platensis SPKY1]
SEMNQNNDFVILPEFTNHFTYDENIYAAYALFGNDVGRYSYQLGLRTEYSDITTLLRETNENNNTKYIDYFPSAHFTYKLTEKDNLQLSYSRRIRRPGFWQLNPFRTYADNRNIWSGNPNLRPVYTNSFETGYLRFWKN